MLQLNDVKNAYQGYARIYDVVFGALLNPGRRHAVKHLECAPDERILEIGVGTGLSFPYYPPSVHVTGVDISAPMLQKAQRRLQTHADLSIDLSEMDAQQLAFADNSFDKVLALFVITTVPDPAEVVNEAVRVCKPGGSVVFFGHLQSQYRWMQMLEKVFHPLAPKLGFRPNLSVKEVLAFFSGEMVEVSLHGPLKHWTLVHFKKPVSAFHAEAGGQTVETAEML